ncbi:MAG: glutamate--tRNA ligase [Pseudomonadota bacterium]
MGLTVRFAPSPTGFLHIGTARTALFNWLFARHHGGRFLLRIEDTDRQRSTPEAIEVIFDAMNWLGLESDEPPVFQATRIETHQAAAARLLEAGEAYHCYCTPAELDDMRAKAKAEKRPMRYDGRWRDRDPSEAPAGVDPVVRLKMPLEGETTIHDAVQGEVKVANKELDDMVLLRADGTPTYMLSVVVDDAEMGITHVIRGDDHLTNTFRQTQLFKALGYEIPVFAHIPLIHGPDGAKLSKRHGALGVDAYRDMGFLPEAVCNYLLRLGWAHGDAEIIDREQAIQWFDLDGVGKSAARFDLQKLTALNGHYIREAEDARLVGMITPLIEAQGIAMDEAQRQRLTAGMPGLKQRAKTLIELAESSLFYVWSRPIPLQAKAAKLLTEPARAMIEDLLEPLAQLEPWTEDALETHCRAEAERLGLGFGKIAQPLRAALTGLAVSRAPRRVPI